MNQIILLGNIAKDPDVRCTTGDKPTMVARYSIAVRRDKDNTDFINLVAFGKNAEFVEKYVTKGMKLCVRGHLQTGSYTNKDGQKVYTTDVIVEEHDFCDSKKSEPKETKQTSIDDFMKIDTDSEGGLPWS